MTRIRFVGWALLPALLWLLGLPVPAGAQATAIVRGTVLDPTGAAIPGAKVQLLNPLHHKHVMETETEADGSFTLYQVPFNPYRMTVTMAGFQTYQQTLEVHASTVTVEVTLRVGALQQQVEVTAPLVEETKVSTHITLDTHELERALGASTSRDINKVLLESAGVNYNANQRMHVRGAHYQVSFAIDGLPVSDQLSIDFGNPFDMNNVEALEVYTGNFPAEYGNKVSGVVNVSTKSGLGSGDLFHGSIGGSLGSFESGEGSFLDSGEGSFQVGGGTNRWGYFVSLGGGGSNRFLDPPSLDNLHNDGNNQSLFARLDYNPTDRDFLHFSTIAARSRFDVPNLPSQDLAGQDQNQRLMDLSLRFTWTHIFNPRWSLELVPYYRTALAQLFPSPLDTPVTASQARHLTTAGGKMAVDYTGRGHHVRAGIDFFAFPVSERFSFGLTDPGFNDPTDPEFNPNLLPHDLTRGGTPFQFDDERLGSEYSAFIQDTYSYRGLTLNLGVRYDAYNFVVDEVNWSPRAGLAYSIPHTQTVLRASFNRLFQTPSNENLLLSTSPQTAALVPPDRVAALGAALLVVPPEWTNLWEAGVQQGLWDWGRVDASLWWKDITNLHDNDQFLNTTVVFPTALTSGTGKGFDLRVEMVRRAGWTANWTFTTGRIIATPPFSGGLFLGEEAVEVLEEGPFRIDHDQSFASQGTVMYEHRSGVWSSLRYRFDSGFPVEIEDIAEVAADPDQNRELQLIQFDTDPLRIKHRLIWDWAIGVDYPKDGRRWALQFSIENLTDETRLFNFLSVFSGSHVYPPRTFSARLRYFF